MSHRIDPIDLNMARAQAAKHGPRSDGDIESAAMKGLLEASRTYTPSKGTWRGYAHMKIKSRITDELRRKSVERAHETLMTTEDLTEVTVTISIDTTSFMTQMLALTDDVREDFTAGHIDRRKPSHRQAIDTLKENLT